VRCAGQAVLVAALLGAAIVPARGEDAAGARVRAMASFLAKAPRLSVTIDCAYDVLQDSGEKIEFGERRVVVLRRPDRARVDVTRRDGSRRGVVFDGTQLAVFDLDEKVYSTVSKPGTVDAAFDYFVNELNMRLPLHELLKSDLPAALKDVVGTARLVASERVGDVATDHIALRGATADMQLWIPPRGRPAAEAHRDHVSAGRGTAAVRG
jgi:hypothetical protein